MRFTFHLSYQKTTYMRRKTFTLLFGLFALATSTYSQILNGSTLLGGTLGFNTFKSNASTIKETSLNISPVF
jgi:hypothetical protein